MTIHTVNPEEPDSKQPEQEQSGKGIDSLRLSACCRLESNLHEIRSLVSHNLEELGYQSQWTEQGLKQVGSIIVDAGVQLSGTRITMVDDTALVLARFAGPLQVATGGSASLLLHREQEVSELAAELLATNPDVVLLDYCLSGFSGALVAEALRERLGDSRPVIIGFSSTAEGGVRQGFLQSGAHGVVLKDVGEAINSLASVSITLQNVAA